MNRDSYTDMSERKHIPSLRHGNGQQPYKDKLNLKLGDYMLLRRYRNEEFRGPKYCNEGYTVRGLYPNFCLLQPETRQWPVSVHYSDIYFGHAIGG